jgi:hypothetical protein
MDRDAFIRVLSGCIESATGRLYPSIEWDKLSDRGLIEFAELVRDLLEKKLRAEAALAAPGPLDGRVH